MRIYRIDYGFSIKFTLKMTFILDSEHYEIRQFLLRLQWQVPLLGCGVSMDGTGLVGDHSLGMCIDEVVPHRSLENFDLGPHFFLSRKQTLHRRVHFCH